MCQRHVHLPPPSPQVVRSTCMQLLPLVEMYCRWELEEDCTDLRALMLRFDSEVDLESHELGHSLLFMVRDEDAGIDSLKRHIHSAPRANPFHAVRERLAAVDLAFEDLRAQVHSIYYFCFICGHHGK